MPMAKLQAQSQTHMGYAEGFTALERQPIFLQSLGHGRSALSVHHH